MESWLKKGLVTAKFFIKGCQVPTEDISQRKHGGVALLIRDEYAAKEVQKYPLPHVEA